MGASLRLISESKKRMSRFIAFVLCASMLIMVRGMPRSDDVVPEGTLAADPSMPPVAVSKMAGAAAPGGQLCDNPPSQTTALLYQIFLGTFGAAYGYVDRWVLFAAALAPGIIGCVLGCIAKMLKPEGEEKASCASLAVGIMACTFCCWNCGFWIWGMVQICNNDLKTGDDCTLKNDL